MYSTVRRNSILYAADDNIYEFHMNFVPLNFIGDATYPLTCFKSNSKLKVRESFFSLSHIFLQDRRCYINLHTAKEHIDHLLHTK